MMNLSEVKAVSLGSESKERNGVYYRYILIEFNNGETVYATFRYADKGDKKVREFVDDNVWDFIGEDFSHKEIYKHFMMSTSLRNEIESALEDYSSFKVNELGESSTRPIDKIEPNGEHPSTADSALPL